MIDHPSPESLHRLLRGRLAPEERDQVVFHLLRGCASCRAVMAPIPEELVADELETSLAEPREVDDEDAHAYEQLIDRTLWAMRRTLGEAHHEARLVAEAYDAIVAHGFSGLSLTGRRFNGPVECLALLRRCQDLCYRDPQQVMYLAWCAVRAADGLEPAEWGAQHVADLRARAWAELGNAHRVVGDLESAERALVTAADNLGEGSQDPLLTARLLSLQASLLGDQRHFAEALGLLRLAQEMYTEVGEAGEAARVLVKRGIYTGYAGDTGAAIRLLADALAELDADDAPDPKVMVTAVHSLAWFLMDAEEWRQLRALLWKRRRLYEEHAGPVLLAKRVWLEGRINAALGEFPRAEERLTAAIRALEASGLGYPAAIASLDLAAVLVRLDRSEQAIALVIQAGDAFFALGIAREALAAIRLLQQAAERGVVTEAILHEATRVLLRVEREPTARMGAD